MAKLTAEGLKLEVATASTLSTAEGRPAACKDCEVEPCMSRGYSGSESEGNPADKHSCSSGLLPLIAEARMTSEGESVVCVMTGRSAVAARSALTDNPSRPVTAAPTDKAGTDVRAELSAGPDSIPGSRTDTVSFASD